MKFLVRFLSFFVSTLLLDVTMYQSFGQTISSSAPRTLTSSSPLNSAAEVLQREYAKVVTYEDLVWVWPGELQAAGQASPTSKWGLLPMSRSVSVPAFNASQSLSNVLNQVVSVFNLQVPAPQFKVTSWQLGFHIIPTLVHDQSGTIVNASNPLDQVISVAEGERSPTAQFQELCSAVSAASGISLKLEASGIRPWLDQAFDSDSDPFVWGASGIVARNALEHLILRSATTLSWQLLCQPSAKAQDRFCFLNIRPVSVNVIDSTGKATTAVLTYDRCGKCPHRTALPPPPPQ